MRADQGSGCRQCSVVVRVLVRLFNSSLKLMSRRPCSWSICWSVVRKPILDQEQDETVWTGLSTCESKPLLRHPSPWSSLSSTSGSPRARPWLLAWLLRIYCAVTNDEEFNNVLYPSNGPKYSQRAVVLTTPSIATLLTDMLR